MIDINFYMKAHAIQQRINEGETFHRKSLFDTFECLRSREPIVYNIETTNACNMKCEMCPRTTLMTRPVQTMKPELFTKIVEQLKPFTEAEWKKWVDFCIATYGIHPNEMSENHFFLYIIPKVIQLHGYGDPLLDKNMPDYIRLLHEKKLQSYFSCNPANLDLVAMKKMCENGLDYVKFSLESTSDTLHKKVRGERSNFSEAYGKILELLWEKDDFDYKTNIVITMLDLNRPNQKEEFRELQEAFEGEEVYLYLKSEDTQWYRKDFHGTKSIHWSEFCKHPWMSMTIKSNGEAAMCMEDYNNEIILGDTNKESLMGIWNSEKYEQFRRDHFHQTNGLKCKERCDMKLIGGYCK